MGWRPRSQWAHCPGGQANLLAQRRRAFPVFLLRPGTGRIRPFADSKQATHWKSWPVGFGSLPKAAGNRKRIGPL